MVRPMSLIRKIPLAVSLLALLMCISSSTVAYSRSVHIIVLTSDLPPIVAYEGHIPRFPATAVHVEGVAPLPRPTKSKKKISSRISRLRQRVQNRLNSSAQHVQAYAAYLRQKHVEIATSAGLDTRKVLYSYTTVLSGFAAVLSGAQQRAKLSRHPLVAAVVLTRGLLRSSSDVSGDASSDVSRDVGSDVRQLAQQLSSGLSSGSGSSSGATGGSTGKAQQVQPLLGRGSGSSSGGGGDSRAAVADSTGQGVVVGVIDAGVWPENPFFSDASFPSPSPPSNWKGSCTSTSDFPSSSCNRRLIGAQMFNNAASQVGSIDTSADYLSPRDATGHGTWCAGAAAGASSIPITAYSTTVDTTGGVAPGAYLAVYKTFWTIQGGQNIGQQADILAAVDKAVADGVDVLSCSFGSLLAGGADAFFDAAMLNVNKAGVFVVFASGNDGSPPGNGIFPTIQNPAPFYLTVGASTIDRLYASKVVLGGSTTHYFKAQPGMPASGQASLVLASSVAKSGVDPAQASICSTNSLDPSTASGAIVLCTYSPSISFSAQLYTVKAAGGVGIMLADVPGTKENVHFPTAISSVHMSSNEAKAVKDYIASAGAGATASLDTCQAYHPSNYPQIASFSSTGPMLDPTSFLATSSGLTNSILKPDITAPGVDLWGATVAAAPGSSASQQYRLLSGTSMSVPFAAGVGAQILAQHPDWSPAQVRSAMMTTAQVVDNNGGPLQLDNGTVVNPWYYGSGDIGSTASKALDPGLTYDTSYGDYVSLTRFLYPSISRSVFKGIHLPVRPFQLNHPNIVVAAARAPQIVVRRTVTNVGAVAATYSATVVAPSCCEVKVSPSSFTVGGGAKQLFKVTLKLKERSGNFTFGSLTWSDGSGHSVRSVLGVQAM